MIRLKYVRTFTLIHRHDVQLSRPMSHDRGLHKLQRFSFHRKTFTLISLHDNEKTVTFYVRYWNLCIMKISIFYKIFIWWRFIKFLVFSCRNQTILRKNWFLTEKVKAATQENPPPNVGWSYLNVHTKSIFAAKDGDDISLFALTILSL